MNWCRSTVGHRGLKDMNEIREVDNVCCLKTPRGHFRTTQATAKWLTEERRLLKMESVYYINWYIGLFYSCPSLCFPSHSNIVDEDESGASVMSLEQAKRHIGRRWYPQFFRGMWIEQLEWQFRVLLSLREEDLWEQLLRRVHSNLTVLLHRFSNQFYPNSQARLRNTSPNRRSNVLETIPFVI